MSTTEELKKGAPRTDKQKADEKKQKAVKDSQVSARDILGKGIENEAQAQKFYEAAGIKPKKEHKGIPVEVLYCTSDGQFFYLKGDCLNHIRKTRRISEEYFIIKVK